MELNASAPYEFLDLTDIDDSERNHLICTLYKTSQEETTSLNDSAVKLSKKSPHGITSTTHKDFSKYSRYETTNYVKNIAAVNLPQQITSNVVAKASHSDQSKGKADLKALNQSGGLVMAQHTSSLHHSQQQLVQSQVHQQSTQQPGTSQTNNLSNYPTHHSQSQGFNQLQHGGVFVPSHSGAPVGGAMFHMLPAAIPSNVYVNNVTANVNLHGYMTHAVPQYIPGTATAYIPGEIQPNVHGSEQGNQIIQPAPSGPVPRTSRRGRGRGNGGGNRRNEYNQRQLASPAPQDLLSSQMDPQSLGPTSYSQYIPYTYQQSFYGAPQCINHTQQATGTPLYLSSHVPMYAAGPTMYQSGFIYPMVAQDYQMLDDKCDEAHPESMMQQIWHPHIQMEYPEDYLDHELIEGSNHNSSPLTSNDTPLTSTDTPSMLSPILPVYDSQLQQSIEMQHMNSLHIYDASSMSQQSVHSDEQIHEGQLFSLINHEGDHISTEDHILEHNTIDRTVEIVQIHPTSVDWIETVSPPIPSEYSIQPNYINNSDLQLPNENVAINNDVINPIAVDTGNVNLSLHNQNVPKLQSSEITTDSEVVTDYQYINLSVGTSDEMSVVTTNKTPSGPIQQKKRTASVAVTATPTSTNKLQPTISNHVKTSAKNCVKIALPIAAGPAKSTNVVKTSSSAELNNLEQKSNQLNVSEAPDVAKDESSSIDNVNVCHPSEDPSCPTNENERKSQECTSSTQAMLIKASTKNIVDHSIKIKKDYANKTISNPVMQNAMQQTSGVPSWASLFDKNTSQSSLNTNNVNNSVLNIPLKKPVAKVLPFEGTSNFANALSPGMMSYSAASAQGLTSSNQNVSTDINNKRKNSFAMSTYSKENIDEWSLKFADFLTKYKIDYSLVSLKPRGLTNRSNYCYINAILQALVGCPPFYNLIKSIPKQPAAILNEKTNTPTINAMIQLISEFSHLPPGVRLNRREKGQNKDDVSMELSCDQSFEPTGIYKLWNASRCDVEGRQEDAEEFLGYVLNKLNDEMLEIIKLIAKPNNDQNGEINSEVDDGDDWQMIYNNRNKGSVTRQTDFGRTPLSDIFRGELRSRLQREGGLSTDVIQPFFTLQLNIEKAVSVKEALEILVGRDQLEGVTCSKTNQEVVAWQQMTLEKLPVVLILHLKWFDYKLDGCTKILKTVEFPVELKIDTKILGSKKYFKKQRLYRLFAVVYHDGKEASKGHYITDVYHAGYSNWLRFDDSTVKPISENNVLHPRAPRVPYLLYYRRCDTVPTPSNQSGK